MSAAPSAKKMLLRASVAIASTAAVALGVPALTTAHAAAAPTPPAAASPGQSALAADQAMAARLASEIRSRSQQIDGLAERANAAAIHLVQVRNSLALARDRLTSTTRALSEAQALLKQEAVDAYTEGGHAALAPTAEAMAATDPSLVVAYGEIVAGTQRDTVASYRELKRQRSADAGTLVAALRSAEVAASTLDGDRRSGQAAVEAEQATLAGVKGRMAVLVAAAETAQATAMAEQEKSSLASEGQLPPSSPPVVPTGAASPPALTTPPVPAPTRSVVTVAPSPAARPPVTAAPRPTTTLSPVVTTVPTTSTTVGGGSGSPPALHSAWAATAIAYARAQLGKPYLFGGSGPASFDCSGLVMEAYAAAGVSFPHLAQGQYDETYRLTIGQLQPGDLVFFGTPSSVGHVGIYIGGGDMIDAPATGQNVSIQAIYWSDLLGGGRVT